MAAGPLRLRCWVRRVRVDVPADQERRRRGGARPVDRRRVGLFPPRPPRTPARSTGSTRPRSPAAPRSAPPAGPPGAGWSRVSRSRSRWWSSRTCRPAGSWWDATAAPRLALAARASPCPQAAPAPAPGLTHQSAKASPLARRPQTATRSPRAPGIDGSHGVGGLAAQGAQHPGRVGARLGRVEDHLLAGVGDVEHLAGVKTSLPWSG